MTRTERIKRTERLIVSILNARNRVKNAQKDYDAHQDDFHYDPKWGNRLEAAKKSLERFLDKLEALWKKNLPVRGRTSNARSSR